MTFLLAWLAVGAVNYVVHVARGNSLLSYRPKRRSTSTRRADVAEAALEAAFFVLAWPVQLLFFLVTRAFLPALERMFQ